MIELSQKQNEFVTAQVELGRFANPNDVIQAALQLLARQDLQERADVNAAIRRGLAEVEAGHTIPLDEWWKSFSAEHGIVASS